MPNKDQNTGKRKYNKRTPDTNAKTNTEKPKQRYWSRRKKVVDPAATTAVSEMINAITDIPSTKNGGSDMSLLSSVLTDLTVMAFDINNVKADLANLNSRIVGSEKTEKFSSVANYKDTNKLAGETTSFTETYKTVKEKLSTELNDLIVVVKKLNDLL